MEGILTAYDATNGAKLWSFDAGTSIIAPPISYRIKGQQYVAVLSGFGGAGALIGRVVPDNQRQNGRLLVFRIGGKAKLKAETPAPRAPIDVTGITSSGDADAGMAEYGRTCSVCHGGNASVAYTADLRRSGALANAELWKAIVIDGALKDMGMVSFADIITPQRAEDIRAYVLRQAKKAQGK
jgi:quinohemoprotein ethanol dehydrogenase